MKERDKALIVMTLLTLAWWWGADRFSTGTHDHARTLDIKDPPARLTTADEDLLGATPATRAIRQVARS